MAKKNKKERKQKLNIDSKKLEKYQEEISSELGIEDKAKNKKNNK